MSKDKIISEEKLAAIVEALRTEGKVVGFTNGAFDIMHVGHARLFERCKQECDVLVVAINTDESVRMYKGPDRPIIGEAERMEMVASIHWVDYVVAMPDRRCRRLLEVLKPTLYLKGGDYKIEQLTSRDVVEKYGGKAVVLGLIPGASTSNIVKKILAVEGGKDVTESGDATIKASTEKRDPSKAVFLDRDGCINEEVEYLHEPEKFKLTPHCVEGVKKMQDLGYKVVVVTTQAGIGLGYFTKEDFYKVNKEMMKAFSKAGIIIDKIYFCPHGVRDGCDCRKPKTGLFERARTELDLDFRQCYMIGDKTSDLKAGENIGAKPILVRTGHAGKDKQHDTQPVYTADNLLDAAQFIEKDN